MIEKENPDYPNGPGHGPRLSISRKPVASVFTSANIGDIVCRTYVTGGRRADALIRRPSKAFCQGYQAITCTLELVDRVWNNLVSVMTKNDEQHEKTWTIKNTYAVVSIIRKSPGN